MKPIVRVLIGICFSLQLLADSKDSILVLMQRVKEASYFDSTRLFTAANSALVYAHNNGITEQILPEINIYYGNYFYYTRNLRTSADYFKKALELSRRTSSSHFEILAQIRLLYIEREYGLMQNTERDLKEFLKLCIQNKDFENELEIYNLLGIVYEERGELKQSVEYYIKGLQKAELDELEYYRATFLNNIGLIKYYLGDLNKALTDFNKGIEIASKINNQRLLSHIKMNQCLVFVGQNRFPEATDLFKEVIQYAVSNKLPLELAAAYINFSSAYLSKEEYDKAINYADSALIVFEKYNFIKEQIKAHIGKSRILFESGRVKEAEILLEKIGPEITGSANPDNISEFCLLKYKMKQSTGQFKEALDYYLRYTKIKDSMLTVFNSKTVDELQIKYNVQKKEIELEKEKSRSIALEKQNQREKFFKWFAVLMGLIVIITIAIIAVIIYNRKIREKQEFFSKQLIIKAEEERSRIAKDLHDDIGQSLSSLKTWLFKGAESQTDDKRMELEIERIIEQTRQISRTLYPSYIEKIGLTPAIAMLAENIQKNKIIEFSFEICMQTEELDVSTKTHLFRIVQECVSNTLKHAQATALKVMIELVNNEFMLTYIDNGNWNPANKIIDGMGLLSVKERTKIIGGVFSLEHDQAKGFKLLIKFRKGK